MESNIPTRTARIRQVIILGGAAIGFVLIVFALQSLSGPRPSKDSNQQTSDTTQGNTNTNTAANENELATPKEGTDFSPLLNVGVKSSYINGLQFALYQYANPRGISVRNATVPENGVTHTVPDVSGPGPYYHTYDFTIKLDASHSFKAKLVALNAYNVQVILYDLSSNAQLYDSGSIDTRNL